MYFGDIVFLNYTQQNMKKLTLIALLITISGVNGFCSENLIDIVKFTSLEKARELLLQDDEFTNSWSQFDIDSRMHKQNSNKEELFDFIAEQAREWTEREINKLQDIFTELDEQILTRDYQLDFPQEIYFIKTTAKEEGGAGGYTRANYVVLKDDILSGPKAALKKTIVHELFHILTRANPDFREAMYAIIGFQLMNPIEYPDVLKSYRITNPDAPQNDSYIRLTVNGNPVDCMMVLYSSQDYSGGEFFKYLNVGFLQLEGDNQKNVLFVNGKPAIYTLQQVSGFFEQVGKNTQYIIHPEEIMADNFAFALLNRSGLQNPEIVDKIKKIINP